MKVLVVDDAQFQRHRLAQVLRGAGIEVVEAADGQAAVQKYAEERPDLVLMDITMPVMDGLEALRRIRAADPEARVIMCSALGQQTAVLEAVKAGALDFLVKPVQPDRLLAAVQRYGPGKGGSV